MSSQTFLFYSLFHSENKMLIKAKTMERRKKNARFANAKVKLIRTHGVDVWKCDWNATLKTNWFHCGLGLLLLLCLFLHFPKCQNPRLLSFSLTFYGHTAMAEWLKPRIKSHFTNMTEYIEYCLSDPFNFVFRTFTYSLFFFLTIHSVLEVFFLFLTISSFWVSVDVGLTLDVGVLIKINVLHASFTSLSVRTLVLE